MNKQGSTRRDFFLGAFRRMHTAVDDELRSGTGGAEDDQEIGAVLNDMTENDLQYEVMKLGIDPSNLNKNEMKTIVLKQMDKSKPQK